MGAGEKGVWRLVVDFERLDWGGDGIVWLRGGGWWGWIYRTMVPRRRTFGLDICVLVWCSVSLVMLNGGVIDIIVQCKDGR